MQLQTTTATKSQNVDFFQNLLLVAIADRYLEESESNFLVQIGQQLGLTEEDVAHLADKHQDLTFIVPATLQERLKQLDAVVQMMLADGQIHQKEYNLCLEFAKQIGIDQEALAELIARYSIK
jgi:uncharacterized tellurite resistance protein B-like protein